MICVCVNIKRESDHVHGRVITMYLWRQSVRIHTCALYLANVVLVPTRCVAREPRRSALRTCNFCRKFYVSSSSVTLRECDRECGCARARASKERGASTVGRGRHATHFAPSKPPYRGIGSA